MTDEFPLIPFNHQEVLEFLFNLEELLQDLVAQTKDLTRTMKHAEACV